MVCYLYLTSDLFGSCLNWIIERITALFVMHQTSPWYENYHRTDVFLGLHPAHTYLRVNQKQPQEREQICMKVKLETIFVPAVYISIRLGDLFDFL